MTRPAPTVWAVQPTTTAALPPSPIDDTYLISCQLGLCNYKPEDMAKYFAICDEKGYVKPAVYQGHYNALARNFEDDLFPLLRKNNCVFYAYRYYLRLPHIIQPVECHKLPT